jgi:putative membrane protein
MSSERRLHPFTVVFAFLTQIRIFIVPGIFVYFGVGSRENDWWQPWMMLFVVPAAGFAILRYLTYRYRYEETELVIRTGLFFRKERHIPYARIQNIDAEQNLLHRFLNVVDIKIETGTGGAAEATMSVLPAQALTEMRERVFAERAAVAIPDAEGAVPTPVDAAPARPLLELPIRELFLCGFIENRGAVLIAAAFGVVWELGIMNRFIAPVFGEPMTARGAIRSALRSAVSNATISWDRIALVLLALVALLLLIRVFSMAWAVVRLYGFRLALVDQDARTEFGLLTRVAMTIPLRRIQTMTVREGPLHRFFERVAVKVDTAGGRVDQQNQASEREYVAPILRRGELDAFATALVGVPLTTLDWQAPHPRAFRREIKGWLVPAGFLCLLVAAYAGWYALAVVPFGTLRHLRWAATDDAIVYKSGWLWRRIVIARFAKAQTVWRYDSPFDRRTGMARVHVDTAGATAGSVVHIPYVPREAADALYQRLSREAAQRQLNW